MIKRKPSRNEPPPSKKSLKAGLQIFIFLLLFITGRRVALAVPPPDFLFNVGSQLIQVFSIGVLFFSALFASSYKLFKIYYSRIKHKKSFWFGIITLTVMLLLTASYFFDQSQQTNAYKKWLIESQKNNANLAVTTKDALKEITKKNVLAASSEIITTQNALQSDSQNISQEEDFFSTHQKTPLAISNSEFQDLLNKDLKNIFVLDARENEEFEIGNFPGSHHIRFADLLESQWQTLPKNETVYVFCWSGMRGKEVVDFLRSKKILARYLEKGANDWVASGGKWIGEIEFSSTYADNRYKRLFTLEELKKEIIKGTVIIDTRSPQKYAQYHLPDSINIPVIYTPTSSLEAELNQIPAQKSVLTICDDFVSCFDAKITGIKLEKKGHQFLGRYNKPWEFRSNS